MKGTVSTNPIGYRVSFGNPLYNPHSGHNADAGGIVTTTGFKVGGDSVNTPVSYTHLTLPTKRIV